jgi:hypothetical protein
MRGRRKVVGRKYVIHADAEHLMIEKNLPGMRYTRIINRPGKFANAGKSDGSGEGSSNPVDFRREMRELEREALDGAWVVCRKR